MRDKNWNLESYTKYYEQREKSQEVAFSDIIYYQ
jgi:hypothetical protein